MRFVWIYFGIINILAAALTAYDKQAARVGGWRVKEKTLMFMVIGGGAVAMGLTMLLIRHKTRKPKFVVGVPLIIILQLLFLVFGLDQSLAVSHFTIESDKIGDKVRLMLITDLHSCDYGDSQERLLNKVYNENPDIVLLCGDIFDDELPIDNTIEFLQGVAGKYPCYFVFGNHEFWSGKIEELEAILTTYGVKVLRGTSDIIRVGNDVISIKGIDDPDTDRYDNNSLPYADQLRSLGGPADHDVFTLLMSHRPERMDEFLPLDFDLVVAGHAHGGQWRIPFILENGLLAPNQGLFPQHTNGKYCLGETVLIVSRGLARESTAVPRLFNRPEIIVITVGNYNVIP